MTTESLTLLNFGAGAHKLDGFINVDIESGADVQADVTKGLPFESNSIDGIYSEHFIEHINQGDGCFFFRECRRILRPGATMRVATPDLDEMIESYAKAGAHSASNREEWLHPDWNRFGYEWVANRCEMLNTAMREWEHQWVYNEEEMVRLAQFCGLEYSGRYNRGESRIPWFKGLEHRDGSTLILEFKKPLRSAFGGAPLVSVCVPAYKPTFFRQAMDSIVSQTYSNLEIIVSDDSVADEIYSITKEYLKDSRVRYTKNPVKGGDENYMHALSHATGQYAKFVNDDDILHPECIQKLVIAAEQHPEATLIASVRKQFVGDLQFLAPDGGFRPISNVDVRMDGQYVCNQLLKHKINFVGEPNGVLFRREDAQKITPDLLKMGGQASVMGTPGDVVMWLNLLSMGDLVYLAEPLSYLRVHENQIQKMVNYDQIGRSAWNRMIQQANRLGLHKVSSFDSNSSIPLESPGNEEYQVIREKVEQGDVRDATILLQKAMEKYGQSEMSMFLLGLLFEKMGQKDQAIETWKSGLTMFPGSKLLSERSVTNDSNI